MKLNVKKIYIKKSNVEALHCYYYTKKPKIQKNFPFTGVQEEGFVVGIKYLHKNQITKIKKSLLY